MSISIHNFAFREARIERILQSSTLAEAQHMGLLDRVIDFFRGGVKRAAIEKIFTEISHQDKAFGQQAKTKQLARFEAMQRMVEPIHLDKLTLEVQVEPQAQTWSYALKVDGVTLASEEQIDQHQHRDYAAFQDGAILGRLATVIGRQVAMPEPALEKLQLVREQFSLHNIGHFKVGDFEADMAHKFTLLAAALQDYPLPLTMQYHQREAYNLLIAGENFYHGAILPFENTAQQFSNHHTHQFVDLLNAGITVACKQALAAQNNNSAQLLDSQRIIEESLKQMAGGNPQALEALIAQLDNPNFNRKKFIGVRNQYDEATFRARFFPGKDFIFSNQCSTKHEMRGQRLKAILFTAQYKNLGELAAHDHLTEHDTLLQDTLKPIKGLFINDQKNKLSTKEISALHNKIKDIPAGKTRLAHIWQLPTNINRILYLFRGDIKQEKIEYIFNAMNTAAETNAEKNIDTKQLERFEALRQMTQAKHLEKFNIEVRFDQHQNTWSYIFKIDGSPLVGRQGINIGSGHHLVAYQEPCGLSRRGHARSCRSYGSAKNANLSSRATIVHIIKA